MTTNSDDKVVTIFAQVAESELPLPGSWVEVEMSNGMTAQLWNLRKGQEVDRRPKHLGYVPVRTSSPNREVIHAAVTRRVSGRNSPDRFTLCSRPMFDDDGNLKPGSGARVVTGIVHEPLDEAVTCKQCRSRLREDGMLD